MTAFLWLPLAGPGALAALVALGAVRPHPSLTALARWAGVLASLAVLIAATVLVVCTARHRVPTAAGGLLRADSLSAYVLGVVGVVGLTATWGGLRPARAGISRRQSALVALFLAAMSLALLTDNLGVMWVAVEATTIATAFLVGHGQSRRSLEAAWKYVVLGSVGVAIAFLGIVLLYAAVRQAGADTLSWVALTTHPPALDHGIVRVAIALCLLGFGTKAGLAPMHSWLPDAHSQAPAPVSALMSGVLLAVAFYAVLRIQAVGNVVIGPGLARTTLVTGGLLSLTVAALLLLRQRDYKRMLAFSSIEHMGLVALGAAAGGPLAISAVLLHVLGHGLAKAVAFVESGRLLDAVGSTRIADVRGLLATRPALGVPWLAALAALLGFPPFSLFFSEVGIVVAGFRAGLGWVMAVALGLLLVAFAGLARHTVRMCFGPGPGDHPGRGGDSGEPAARQAPVALALGVLAVAGFLAVPLGRIIADAAAVLHGAS